MVYDSISPLGTEPMRSHEIPWSVHVEQGIKAWESRQDVLHLTTLNCFTQQHPYLKMSSATQYKAQLLAECEARLALIRIYNKDDDENVDWINITANSKQSTIYICVFL